MKHIGRKFSIELLKRRIEPLETIVDQIEKHSAQQRQESKSGVSSDISKTWAFLAAKSLCERDSYCEDPRGPARKRDVLKAIFKKS